MLWDKSRRLAGAGQDGVRRWRWRGFLAALLFQSVFLLVVIAAFAPRKLAFTHTDALASFTVRPQQAVPPPRPSHHDLRSAGRRAESNLVAASKPELAIARLAPAAPVAGNGMASSSGDAATGADTGGGGSGLVQISGAIDSIRDYPPDPKQARIDTSVLIAFTVGVDGRVHHCHILRPSGDAIADAITCRLAEVRFRFRPARDATGNLVASPYGWQQRWFR